MPLQEYDRGGQEKIKQTNKHEQCLGLTQSRRRVCNTTCMCRLTLAWVTSENSTKQLECRHFLTRSSSLDPIFSAAVSPLRCPVSTPLSVVPRQLPASPFLPPTLFRVPLPLPDTARFQVQKPFVWFRAKTDKGIVCLAGHLFSVTKCFNYIWPYCVNKLKAITLLFVVIKRKTWG